MKTIQKEISIWLHLIIFIVIWIALLIFTKAGLNINWQALKQLPNTVSVYLILRIIFTQWIWRWSIFRGWLVRFPDLQGTWEGQLKTTWRDPKTGKIPSPISLIIVIKQSYDSIICTMQTEESSSTSGAILLNEDEKSEVFYLSYLYLNKSDPIIRERSRIHDGAAVLQVIKTPKRKLKGEYWTNRMTTGSIEVKFRSYRLEEEFPERLKRGRI